VGSVDDPARASLTFVEGFAGLALAKRALELTGPRNQGALEVLAASYAAAGMPEEAAAAQKKALEMASAAGAADGAAQADTARDRAQRPPARRPAADA